MKITIVGAGAFGTALAVALTSTPQQITLVGRNADLMDHANKTRSNPKLPNVKLPETLHLSTTSSPVADADVVLLAIPAQTLRHYVDENHGALSGKPIVVCCKGIDLASLTTPTDILLDALPQNVAAVLTGPSFAADIARGLPTALTLACSNDDAGQELQLALSTATLRLYRTTDVMGAQLGGALKNVMAIACGATIGAGLGDSARAALMTRGFAEIKRLAAALGARPDTLHGLSGLGDLALTCTSEGSRNFRFGVSLGAGHPWDETTTVEGAATAQAALGLATHHKLDLPITQTVAGLVSGSLTIDTALQKLLSRPLKEE